MNDALTPPDTVPEPVTPKPLTPAEVAALYRTEIPGGGTATWWRGAELPPRSERLLNVQGTLVAPALSRMVASGVTDPEVDQVAALGEMENTEADLERVYAMQDLIVFIFLRSLVGADGEALHMPTSQDDVLNYDRALYDSLIAAGAKIRAYEAFRGDQFDVDGVDDPNSPTGGSAV